MKQSRQKFTTIVKPKVEPGIILAWQQKTIEDAVYFINHFVDKASSSIIEVGEYLLRYFFNDDVTKVHDRAPGENLSFRRLAEHTYMTLPLFSLLTCRQFVCSGNATGDYCECEPTFDLEK